MRIVSAAGSQKGFRPLMPLPRQRAIAAAVIIVIALAIVAAAFIPVEHPSSSILYKFGWDRTLLLSGKIMGITIVCLLLVQLMLAARLSALDRIVPQNRLISLHRGLGVIIVTLAVAHPLLIFAPEDITTIPLEWDYWPEVVGAVLLLTVCFLTGVTLLRDSLRLPHGLWKIGHRLGAGAVIVGFAVHVHYVNDGFDKGLPYAFIWGATALGGAFWLWTATRPWRLAAPYEVAWVGRPGRDTVEFELTPRDQSLAHAPGQYAYLRFDSKAVSSEEHPFTIASAPTEKGLRFTIRCAGDFTRLLPGVAPGEAVRVDAPYGQFSYLAAPWARRFVLVAGGVGITPMLSMLRHMAASGDTQKEAILLWSNRKAEDVVHR
ncbi:MAG: ferric reductase-like transmembrane domain-containing protein, partial [Oceanidesulfovibrio sp.]